MVATIFALLIQYCPRLAGGRLNRALTGAILAVLVKKINTTHSLQLIKSDSYSK